MKIRRHARPLAALALTLTLGLAALADTIHLKDGQVIRGQIVSFRDQQFTVLIGSGTRGRQPRLAVIDYASVDGRRRLILVPRETPLHLLQLRNLVACAEAGAVVLPAMPAFYTRPTSLRDAVDFIVGRVCDQLGVEHHLLRRWGQDEAPQDRE